jgi:hypothetical protein
MRKCFDEGVLQSFCDGELSDARAKDVTVHLTQCTSCSALMSELTTENDLVSSALAAEFQAAVPTERLRERIEGAIAGLRVAEARPELGSVLSKVDDWFAGLFGQRQVLGYASLVVVLAVGAVFGLVYLKQSPTPVAVVAVNSDPPPKATPSPESPESPQPGPTVKQKPSETPAAAPRKNRPRPIANSAVAKVKLLPGERSYLKTIANLNSTIEKVSDRPMRPDLQAEYERNLAVVDRALAAARSAAKKNPGDPDAVEFVYAAYQSKVDLLNTVADARVFNRQQ